MILGSSTRTRRFRAILIAAALTAAASLLGGCLSNQSVSGGTLDSTVIIDPFPKPLGDAIIPLDQEAYSRFKYVEFDTAGALVMREDIDLHIIPKGGGLYGYAFENPRSGYLLSWSDGKGDRDSSGIYIVGGFVDSASTLLANPVLWLPQFPKPGVTWSIQPGRYMELISADTAFYTEILFRDAAETAVAPIEQGFQKHHTLLFRETYGDTLTYYHFRRGVGCLGFERSTRGKLLATGYIHAFYGKSLISRNAYGL